MQLAYGNEVTKLFISMYEMTGYTSIEWFCRQKRKPRQAMLLFCILGIKYTSIVHNGLLTDDRIKK